MTLTISQSIAVDKLFKKYLNYSFNGNKKNSFAFKAPTGSGKTFMASSFISRVISDSYSKKEKIIVVVATISNAELPKQFAKKLNEYKKFHSFNNYEIDYVESPSNVKNNKFEDFRGFNLPDRKIFVFGTSSFGKNTLFFQNKVLEEFLQKAKNFGYKILFIRDEAHIGGCKINKQGSFNLDRAMKGVADFVLEMTATPKNNDLIELRLEDMEDDGVYLLKNKMEKTKLDNEIDGEISSEKIIDDALKTFVHIKKDYEKIEDFVIRPALLVQISNDANMSKDPIKHKKFIDGLALLEKKLDDYNLVYLKYIDNKPIVINSKLEASLNYASKLDSQIDVIIFKIGPATGWDIPRANMLLQLRDVSSESLNVQTLGRIMRNPYPNLQKNDVTMKYYVWSNYQKPTRDLAFYKLKDKFIEENFYSGRINRDCSLIRKDNEGYRKEVIKYLESSDFDSLFLGLKYENIKYSEISYSGKAIITNKIPNMVYLKIYNLNKAVEFEKNYKISLFLKTLEKVSLRIEKNYEIVKYVFFHHIEAINKIKIKNTKWIEKKEPYFLNNNVNAMISYSIWVDNLEKNKKPKQINTVNLENYGYVQISTNDKEKFIQYLDSEPELKFAEKIFDIISSEKAKEKINFFSKMPTLGSQIYFEYFSNIMGGITKSYIDFALKYNKKVFMFEVKSKNNDYSPMKTNELLSAYRIYMEKFSNKNINLILCDYDNELKKLDFHAMVDGEWKDNLNLIDIMKEILI